MKSGKGFATRSKPPASFRIQTDGSAAKLVQEAPELGAENIVIDGGKNTCLALAIHRMSTEDAFIMSRSSLSMSMALGINLPSFFQNAMREPRCRRYGHLGNSHQKSARKIAGMQAGCCGRFVSCLFRHEKSSHVLSLMQTLTAIAVGKGRKGWVFCHRVTVLRTDNSEIDRGYDRTC